MSIDTVNDLPPRVQYVALAAQDEFDYTFPIFSDSDLVVYVDGTLLTSNDYTVSGAGDDTGGTITLDTALDGGEIVTIYRDIPIARETDIGQNGAWSSRAYNDEQDKVFLIMQQLEAQLRRGLRIPITAGVDDADIELDPANFASMYLTFDADGTPTPAALSATTMTKAIIGQLLYPRTGDEIAAGVTPSDYAIPSHEAVGKIIVERYGGAPGVSDNSAAFNRALAVADVADGGVISFNTEGEWRMNVTIARDNVWLEGFGGRAEFDVNCIRPFSLTSAAVTWGDGLNVYRYCGMRNVAMSGTDDVGGANYNEAAHSAPHCLLIRGGMVGFHTDNVWLYNGVRTLSLETTVDAPITGLRFSGGGARNDIEDSANARTIYANRLGVGFSDGYYTDNVFMDTKFNGPGGPTATLGYLAEFDGTLGGIIAEFVNTYFDFRTDAVSPATVCHGVLMKGGNSIRGHALTLDSGSSGAVYIESDQAPYDIARLLSGQIIANGGGLIKFAGPTYVSLPSEAGYFEYLPRLHTPSFTGQMRFTTTADPYDVLDVLPFIWTDSDNGPITVNRSDLSVKTAGMGLRVKEGSNCKQGTATLVGGTVVVSNTSVTANSRIFLTSNTDGGTPGFLRVSARSAGVSFTITSSNGADTSTVAYQIFEPA
jgi:hypothetical protein